MERDQQEINHRSDPRYFEVPIPCMHCRHLVSVGSQFKSDGWTCTAFPEQIPYTILTLREYHTKPMLPGRSEETFDPVIYTEEDTGLKWHYNADGSWKYVGD